MSRDGRVLTLLPILAVTLLTIAGGAAAQDAGETPMNLGVPRSAAAPVVPPSVVAHADAARAPSSQATDAVAHRGTAAPIATGDPIRARNDVLGRVAAEASVELLTLGALGVVPGLVAGLTAQPCPAGAYVCLGPDFFAEFFSGIGGTIALAFTPFFVGLAGDAMGGRGDTGAAYLGMLGGAAVAGGTLALGVVANDPGVLAAMLVVGALAVLAGPIVGYEVADHEARGRRGTGTAWVPTFGVTRDGATIGVAAQL